MQALSYTEENYIKTIYKLQDNAELPQVSVSSIAKQMHTQPATVTDMLKKLSEKKLVEYEKYKKPKLSTKGTQLALQIIRKHRLWEVFLYEKLHFSWDEIHEVAEELEHVQSAKLIERLDEFLDYPKFDPHGDAIPNAVGEMEIRAGIPLTQAILEKQYTIIAVRDSSSSFLQQLKQYPLSIGMIIKVIAKMPFDNSMVIQNSSNSSLTLSEKVAQNLLISQ